MKNLDLVNHREEYNRVEKLFYETCGEKTIKVAQVRFLLSYNVTKSINLMIAVPTTSNQRVRYERGEILVLIFYKTFYSDSNLPILVWCYQL